MLFFLSCVCIAFVRVCLYVPCGHLLGNITLNLVNFCTQNTPIFLHQKFMFFAQTCSVICDLVQLEYIPGHVAQSVTCLATDASLTADLG